MSSTRSDTSAQSIEHTGATGDDALKVSVVFTTNGDAGPGGVPPVSDHPAMTAATDDGPKPRVEGYQLIALLGQGGMGTVWHARQLSTNREVAIKFLRGGAFGSADARRRFEREVELAGQLKHPHITRLYHSGIHEGAYFYAMELVNGQPLTDHVSQQGLSRRAMLQLFRKVCEAVGHAHHHGVIHRDLKPSNIFVDADGDPHLLDFGLARGPSDAGATTCSHDGVALGTLAYMAPEQAVGTDGRIDTRADVYSLGVILFELLTGTLPRATSGSQFEMQRRVVEEEAPSPRSVDRAIDRELNAIVTTALAHDTRRRYATASDLAVDIGNYLNQEPIRARPLTLCYLLHKRIAKHRNVFALAVLVVALLIGAAGYSYLRIHHERDRARQAATSAERSLYLTRIALARKALADGAVAEAQQVLASASPELRQWEWYRLRYEADQSIHVFAGHDAPVGPIAVHDGRVVSLDRYGTCYHWSLSTGEALLHHENLPATHLRAISADGEIAVFGTLEGVALYATRSGRMIDQRDMSGDSMRYITISGDGMTVAAASPDVIEVWDRAADGDDVQTHQLDAAAHSLVFGQADELIYASGQKIWLLRLRSGEVRRVGTANARVDRLVVGPSGQLLASIDATGAAEIWRLDGEAPAPDRRIAPQAPLRSLAFSPNGQSLVAGTDEGVVQLWDIAGGKLMGEYRGHGDWITSLAFASNEMVISGSRDNTVRVWRLDHSVQGVHHLRFDDTAPVTAVAFCPSRQIMAAGDARGTLRIRDARDASWQTLDRAASPVRSLEFAATGRWLAAAHEQSVDVWRAEDWKRLAKVGANSAYSPALAWLSPATRFATTSYRAGTPHVQIWSVSDDGLTRLQSLVGSHSVAVAKEHGTLLTILPDRRAVQLYDTDDWHVAATLTVEHGPAQIVAISDDGRFAAVVDRDYRVCIWDLENQNHRVTLHTRPSTPVHDLIFIPGHDRLVTAGRVITVWDVHTGVNLLELEADQPTDFYSLAFDPEASRIMAGAKGAVITWYVAPGLNDLR